MSSAQNTFLSIFRNISLLQSTPTRKISNCKLVISPRDYFDSCNPLINFVMILYVKVILQIIVVTP